MKTVIKWILTIVLALAVVIVILVLATWLARPFTEQLTGAFTGYVEEEPEIVTLGEDLFIPGGEMNDWASSEDMPEHCTFSVSGRVTQNDGAPIPDAEVKIYNSGLYDMGDFEFTDRNGRFTYTEFGTETCDKEYFYLSISKNGFEPYFYQAESGEELDISLTSIFYN